MTPRCSRRRRFLVPEVVQTSAMDCGPAVLKCLLEGFGIPAHYGRLREACQTDVDGTSIEALEAVAVQVGLKAELTMMPVDHLLLLEADALPAIVVVRRPDGLTHFVLAWRRHGPLLQIMDPAVGRRWVRGERFLQEVYIHALPVAAEVWRTWTRSNEFERPLVRRLRRLGLNGAGKALVNETSTTSDWRPRAALDAATRLVEWLVRRGGIRRGREARRLVNTFLERAREEAEAADIGRAIPGPHWSVCPGPLGRDGQEQVLFRGAVLVKIGGRFRGRASTAVARCAASSNVFSRELTAALAEPAVRPGRTLLAMFLSGGLVAPLFLGILLAIAAAGLIFEAILFRAVLDLRHDLGLVEQRLQGLAAFLVLAAVLLLVELNVAGWLARLGRSLETRLRLAFLEKIPRLHDRYLQSRPTSDMAERSHSLHQVRLLPRLGGQFVRTTFALATNAAAIVWADPPSAALAIVAAALAIATPVVLNTPFGGYDLRVRTHAGALGRYYLDALYGLAAVRAHGAERVVRGEHEGLLVDWARASRRLLGWVVTIEGLQAVAGFGLAGWLLGLHAGRAIETGGALLLAYWVLNLPVLGGELALLARQYPLYRNVTLRLLEPLGAPEETIAREESRSAPPVRLSDTAGGVSIVFESVTVVGAGQTILAEVDLTLEAGSQVAIVGPSGAGKSSLVGLLLGWHRPALGRILVDGEPLDAGRLDRLRAETAWVDPAVQLWNRPLVDNLLYGAPEGEATAAARMLGAVLDETDLYDVVRRLPDGLQTIVGEGGGLLSGGEGQRVRLGRGLLRPHARLVILDEPFRGLDREQRRSLLQQVRRFWQGATLLCITHDVSETRDFERVLVIESGRVVEDGPTARLAEEPGTRYQAMLAAETVVRAGLWSSASWRHLRLEAGKLGSGTHSVPGRCT